VVLPVLPTHDPHAAVGELERVAGLGHRGAVVYCFEFHPGDPAWDRLWAAAEDTGLPLSFHIGGGPGMLQPVTNSWQSAAFSAVVPMRLADPLATMIFSGALERHPSCKLVLAEAGLGWIPYLVHRMDLRTSRSGPAADYKLKELPSDIFQRQVYVTFQEEANGTSYLRMVGPQRFMWASDYPHSDSTFPYSKQAIQTSFSDLDEADCRALTADTCRHLYRLN
jgi:predicted TIM-barrel fold metal-dependent hydrolase